MTKHGPLFDAAAARNAREAAIDRVEGGADVMIKTAMLDAVRHCAWTMVEFTTDDVWKRLTDAAVPAPNEPRVLGAVMRHAVQLGWITKTDRVINGTLVRQHRRPLAVWTSKVVGK